MKLRIGSLVCLLSVVLLTACALPRGAALQSEILARDEDAPKEFAVYPVTKDTLSHIGKWHLPGNTYRNWIKHKHVGGGAIIKPGDKVSVIIWDSDDNSLLTSPGQRSVEMPNLEVSANGTIFIPYLGSVKISGMSADSARRKLQDAVASAAPSAQIQLSVETGPRHTVDLIGGVAKPGAYPIPVGHFSALNLISQGGGVNAGLRNPQISLTRASKRYQTSLERLYEDPSLDTIMRAGDKVVILQDDRYFRALGATAGDALHYFERETVTAIDALAMIGGLSDTRANPKGILILREYPSRFVRTDNSGPAHVRSIFVVDLTSADGTFSAGKFKIAPQDTILVTESPVNSARTVFGLIGSVFGLANVVP